MGRTAPAARDVEVHCADNIPICSHHPCHCFCSRSTSTSHSGYIQGKGQKDLLKHTAATLREPISNCFGGTPLMGNNKISVAATNTIAALSGRPFLHGQCTKSFALYKKHLPLPGSAVPPHTSHCFCPAVTSAAELQIGAIVFWEGLLYLQLVLLQQLLPLRIAATACPVIG